MSKITEIKQVGIPIKDANWLFEWLKKRAKEASIHDKASDAFAEAAGALKVFIDTYSKNKSKLNPIKMVTMIGLLSQLVVGCGPMLSGISKGMNEYESQPTKSISCITTGMPGMYTTNCS